MFNKGDILRLSTEGLDWLSGNNARARLETLRFEYVHKNKHYPESISVKRVGAKSRYESYHNTFLEALDE